MKILKKLMSNMIRQNKQISRNSTLMTKKLRTDGADTLEPWVLKLSVNNQKQVFFCSDLEQQESKSLKTLY